RPPPGQSEARPRSPAWSCPAGDQRSLEAPAAAPPAALRTSPARAAPGFRPAPVRARSRAGLAPERRVRRQRPLDRSPAKAAAERRDCPAFRPDGGGVTRTARKPDRTAKRREVILLETRAAGRRMYRRGRG